MENSDLISVIMSTYNEEEDDLRDAINSILNQSYKNFEYIIVNDNPANERLKLILNEYASKDDRVIVVNNTINMGLAQSLNKALKYAKGKYVARMDADDISYPNRLQIQYEYLEKYPDCDLVSSNRIDISEKSELLGTETNFEIDDENIIKVLLYGSVIIHPTVMLKKSLYDEMKGYNNFRAAQDYDLWLRILSTGYKVHILPDKLLKYRIRFNSITKVNFFRQYCYSKYAVEQYKKSISSNSSTMNYSDEDINFFLDKMGLNDQKYVSEFNKLYYSIHNLVSSKNIFGLVRLIPQIVTHFEIVNVIIREFKFKKALSKCQNIKLS